MLRHSPSLSNDTVPILSFAECLIFKPSSDIYIGFFLAVLFLLFPVCVFIVYLGLQKWWQHCSTSKATTMSHTDSFTYQVVSMQFIFIIGCSICCCGILSKKLRLVVVGNFVSNYSWYGENFFHMLICAERYLAVIHPITYLSLRGERGIRIRNICNVCLWISSFGVVLLTLLEIVTVKFDLYLLIFSMITISFCSLGVLHILIRPGPGAQGGDRKRVDQAKWKALYIIMGLLAVLLLRISGSMLG